MAEESKKSTAKKSTSAKTASTKKTTKTTKKVNKSEEMVEPKKTVKKTVKKEEPKKVEVEVNQEEVVNNEEKKGKSVEERRILVILGIIGFFILLFIASAIVTNKHMDNQLGKIKEIKSSADVSAIYLMKEECSYCSINKPNMQTLKNTYGVDYYEVDVAAVGETRRSQILSELGIDEDTFGTPTLVLTQNNEVLEVITGVQAFNNLFNKLQSYKLISEDKKLYLNYIDYAGYNEILKSSTPEILVLTSTTCHYCIEERPILETIAKDYNVKINWIYLNGAFKTQEEVDAFNSSLTWFTENSNWGTPTTLVIQNGQVISALSGYREKDEIIKFYRQNGFIK